MRRELQFRCDHCGKMKPWSDIHPDFDVTPNYDGLRTALLTLTGLFCSEKCHEYHKVAQIERLLSQGVMTINEVRAQENVPRLSSGDAWPELKI